MSKNSCGQSSFFGRSLRGVSGNESGAAIVEFAFLMPLLVLLAVGIMDLGMLMLKYRHASQVAASLAQTSAQLSVANRDGTKGAANTLTEEQNLLLRNGLISIMGQSDAEGVTAEAKRVIRSGNELNTDWSWSYRGDKGAESDFPLTTPALLAQIATGESMMVVDVSFTYNFFFSHYFGAGQTFVTHYKAGVPSY